MPGLQQWVLLELLEACLSLWTEEVIAKGEIERGPHFNPDMCDFFGQSGCAGEPLSKAGAGEVLRQMLLVRVGRDQIADEALQFHCPPLYNLVLCDSHGAVEHRLWSWNTSDLRRPVIILRSTPAMHIFVHSSLVALTFAFGGLSGHWSLGSSNSCGCLNNSRMGSGMKSSARWTAASPGRGQHGTTLSAWSSSIKHKGSPA